MGWVRCPCGTQISDVGDPCPQKGHIVGDCDAENYEIQATNTTDLRYHLIGFAREVWECYECGCIAVDHPESGSNKVKWYKPMDGVKGDVMKAPTSPSPTPEAVLTDLDSPHKQ